MGEGKGRKKSYKQRREANHKRLLNTENKLKVDEVVGERGKWVMGIEEGTCWDEYWMLYASDDSCNSTPKTKSTLYTLLANLTINYIFEKIKNTRRYTSESQVDLHVRNIWRMVTKTSVQVLDHDY